MPRREFGAEGKASSQCEAPVIGLRMHSYSASTISLQPSQQEWQAWLAIVGLVLFSALSLLLGAGSTLRLAFPVAAFAVGLFLYRQHPVSYVGFTWWIWFLTPLVRRLIDYQSGWVDPSPVLLTPFLVTMIACVFCVRHLGEATRYGGLAFVLAGAGVLYAFGIGLIKNSPTDAVRGLLNWLTPIVFGFYLFINWRDYESYRRVIQRTFLWGVLLMGCYGVMQFIVAPEWDRFWLANVQEDFASTAGLPEPYGIRVWSTLNSPHPFGVVMMAGLLTLFSSKSLLRFPAATAGYLAFLLSLVRTAWVGWFVGLLCFIISLKVRLKMRFIIAILVMMVCMLPLFTMDPFAEVIRARLETLIDPVSDGSYDVRLAAYGERLGESIFQPLGKGLGGVETITDAVGVRDSAILQMFFTLGWAGNVLYIGALLMIIASLLRLPGAHIDLFASAARAIVLGVLIEFGFLSAMLDVSGMVLWGFAGIALAAHTYHQHQHNVRHKMVSPFVGEANREYGRASGVDGAVPSFGAVFKEGSSSIRER